MEEEKETLGIMELVQADDELRTAWEQLDESAQEMFRQIDEKKRVPDILNDVMFKGVFDPEVKPEWLSGLISSVLGRKVKIISSLIKEGKMRSRHSKGMILDIPVEFLDAEYNGEEIADVEIQRRGIQMPPKRAALYSAELVTRQYAADVDEMKSEVDYDRVHPVHMIVILEDTPPNLKKYRSCVHHFNQESDTGIVSGPDFELLQYFHYVSLDVFRETRPRIARKLEKWMDFLSIRDVTEMMQFLAENPEFQPMYQKATEMLADRKELLNMFHSIFENEDIAGSINLTNESIIKRLNQTLERKDQELRQTKHETGMALQKKDMEISEKDHQIAELQRRLAELRH